MTDTPAVPASVPDAPARVPKPGRDARGYFLPGHNLPAPGRPRGYDLKKLAEEESEREGFDIRAAFWRVLKRMIVLAEGGDVQAAKLVLDRLGMPDDVGPGGLQLTVVTGVDSTGAPATGIGLRVTGSQGGDD